LKLCKRVGVETLGRNSARQISEDHSETMYTLWTDYLN
jgi:hypothetical protein